MNTQFSIAPACRRASLALCLAALASCAVISEPPSSASAVPEIRKGTGYLIGYIPQNDLPKSDVFLPAAPQALASGSSDEVTARRAFLNRNTARWELATRDADLRFPTAAQAFSCALGFEPSETRTPNLIMLLRRTMADAGLSTYGAKNKFSRVRPFVELKEQSCTPSEESFLAKDGSYPSGHAAVGWAWALVLAELAPTQRDEILRRGYAFGQSRVYCGVHWQSDVDAGRAVGAAAVASLRNNATFRRQFELAKQELAAADRLQLSATSARCVSEQAAEAER